MKYWKNGFYLEQDENKTRYELTDAEWENLLAEQSKGKEIYDDNGVPKTRDFVVSDEDKALEEIAQLKQWFDIYYTQHEQKYRRLIALGIIADSNKDVNNQLKELYQEAEKNRKRIQELEAQYGL